MDVAQVLESLASTNQSVFESQRNLLVQLGVGSLERALERIPIRGGPHQRHDANQVFPEFWMTELGSEPLEILVA